MSIHSSKDDVFHPLHLCLLQNLLLVYEALLKDGLSPAVHLSCSRCVFLLFLLGKLERLTLFCQAGTLTRH